MIFSLAQTPKGMIILEYTVNGQDIHLKQNDLNLDETLDCGQAFRWEKIADGYHGFFLNRPLTITAEKDYFVFHDTTEKDFIGVWIDYFDLATDYGELKRIFSEDETLSKACNFAGGIRLLRQDKWEALCSFIISQNNNIPRIKGIISRLCEVNNGFPAAEQLSNLSVDDLSYLRSGFRAKYILDAAKKVSDGEINLNDISKSTLEASRKKLISIVGVGPKVAECALLYGMYRIEAFPVDVWIKRVMSEYYPNGLPNFILPYAGIAQQYLFHYIRNI